MPLPTIAWRRRAPITARWGPLPASWGASPAAAAWIPTTPGRTAWRAGRPGRARAAPGQWVGSVALVFDVDEHTGMFGGAKAFFGNDPGPRPDGVMIGYPGPDHVVTGGRGVLRARLDVHGVAGHSGSGTVTPSAIAKAA